MKKAILILMVLSLLLCGCGKNKPVSETDPIETDAPTEYVQEIVLEPEITGPEAEVDPEDMTEPVATETVIRMARTSVFNDRGEETLYREYVYDQYGRQTESWEYSDGEVLSFSITTWISDTEAEITYSYYEEGTLTRMVYDEAGNPILNERIENGTVVSSTTHSYDEYGNNCATESTQGGVVTAYVYEFTYDGQGNPLVRKEFMNGSLMGWLEMEYDSQGREVSTVYYYPDGSVNYTSITTYDGEKGTSTSYFDAGGVCYLTQITVTDELGSILSRETWQGSEMVSRTENTYEELEIIAE